MGLLGFFSTAIVLLSGIFVLGNRCHAPFLASKQHSSSVSANEPSPDQFLLANGFSRLNATSYYYLVGG